MAVLDRGQGLNNAITDAADFLVHLREMKEQTPEELAAAVKRYEVELWPRGNEAVLASHENTNAVHDWNTMMQSPLFTGGLAKLSKKEQAAKDEEEAEAAGESKK
jgi:2-polyprenyl-6-methoxyphenol hydroxylase-like FAD-dependent oxidoreductase